MRNEGHADTFIAEDVRTSSPTTGTGFLELDKFSESQKRVTLRLAVSAVLTDETFSQMLRHLSIQIDGRTFPGRPLGHRLDSLRCELDVLDPNDLK